MGGGGAGVTVAMVGLEFAEIGMSTLNKAAMNRGMNQFIFIFYSNALAVFLLLPFSFLFYRKRSCPPLTLPIISRILLLGFLSCSVQILLNLGVKYGSPTLSSAITDLTPAFTFLLAIILRMEKLDVRIHSSQAKFIGTLLSIAGALVATLYKGNAVFVLPSDGKSLSNLLLSQPISKWAIGGIFSAVGALCISLMYIVQTWTIKAYPAELMFTLIANVFVTLQSAVVSLIAVNDYTAWRIKLDLELIVIVLSAVFGASLRNVVHTWACHKRGPLYTSMFKPLRMVIAVCLGVSFLGDTLYIGSVIGGATIAIGFYAVIWGKSQELKMIEDVEDSESESISSAKVPFLKNRGLDA